MAASHQRDLEEVSTGALIVKFGLLFLEIHIFNLNFIPNLCHRQDATRFTAETVAPVVLEKKIVIPNG